MIGVLLGATSLAAAETTSQADEFAAAGRFYEEKDYPSAIRLYENILAAGAESDAVYFNLGNAYFKAGDLGHAILNYYRARRLNPSDDDVLANLQFARQFSRIQMEGVQLNPIGAFMDDLVGRYRLDSLAWFSTFAFWLVLAVLAVRLLLRWKEGLAKVLLVVSVLLLVLVSGLTTYKYRTEYITKRAVILAEQSPVYTGPSAQADVELQGAPGLLVEILGEDTGFYNVLFENGRRGWIKADLVAVI